MAFRVVESEIRTYWAATDGSSTFYIGQMVSYNLATKAQCLGTVTPIVAPNGAADTSGFQIPAGIVIGFNNDPVYDSTGAGSASVLTQAAQATRLSTGIRGAEGMYSKGDPQLLVKIVEITPHTIIEGPIYNNALGTAPTVVYDTVGTDTTGYTTAGTTGACDFTPVASNCTIYCRTGKNAGLYRVTNDTSTTAPDTNVAFPYDVALGDSFVRVPFKQGHSFIYIDGPGLYVNCSKTAATHYFTVFVYSMDLSTAGKETVQFRFATTHFDSARA